jgi:PIN domain nuclease of toxin-antitoxin system
MRLLLHTHIFLWWVNDDARLSKDARAKILDASDVYVSSASIWEATIKVGLKKLHVDRDKLVEAVKKSGFSELPVTMRHAAFLSHLPPIHKDPFDRILIAQAMEEPLLFLTADHTLKEYSELIEIVT